MKSRVHPTYKAQYHVQNWAASDRALVCRGDITIWLSPAAIAAWEPDGAGTRGAVNSWGRCNMSQGWRSHGATTGVELIEAVNDDIASVTADASLRHGWLLRCGRCTGRDRRGPADQDGQGVPTEAAVERS